MQDPQSTTQDTTQSAAAAAGASPPPTVQSVNLEHEMRSSYLDYAMSVIVGRALPDVHDGLKPVHRRVLYAMSELGNEWNKPYKKSARITGDVIGKYHPHSDTAVYDAIVRMAQDFSMRYPLIDGQGNFGSVDGDAPAAMRYTEIRLQRIAHELLVDLEKETVDFGPNYDDTEMQPLVLPARIPNLLINGSAGIAVGMATNIPPHNINEVINACLAFMDNNDISLAELMKIMPAPDFPTAGIINGGDGIHDAYSTGRGRIYVRGRVTVEQNGVREDIIVSELPYQVNKARLLEKIAELVKNGRLEGISSLRDESDKSGMRMVISLKRGEVPQVIINRLYRLTHLETVFGINMVALVNNQPRVFTLKGIIQEFIYHRRQVVTRRTIFDLHKTRVRAHILEGYAVALANIDAIIALIKSCQSPSEARTALMKKSWLASDIGRLVQRLQTLLQGPVAAFLPSTNATMQVPVTSGLDEDGYRLSESQAQAILELRLHRLTGLEQSKIHGEYNDALAHIADLSDILVRRERLMEVVRAELEEVQVRFGDARRTELWQKRRGIDTEDLIAEEDVVVTMSHAGYAKVQPLDVYRRQRRGGRGRTAMRTRDEDFIKRLFLANTHDTVLCFSNRGLVYWLQVHALPQAGPQARGKPLVNLLPLRNNEQVTTLLPVRDYDENLFVVMATVHGYVKRCPLSTFARTRTSGLRAINLVDNDELVTVTVTDDSGDIMLFSDSGKAVRFTESEVRVMGRTARGVRCMKLSKEERIISMLAVPPAASDSNNNLTVLTATTHGYGKRTSLQHYPVKSRGGKGVISISTSARNGKVIGAQLVHDNDDVVLITDGGTLIRTSVQQISITSRAAQGVRLIRLQDQERLHNISRVEVEENGAQDDDNASSKIATKLADKAKAKANNASHVAASESPDRTAAGDEQGGDDDDSDSDNPHAHNEDAPH